MGSDVWSMVKPVALGSVGGTPGCGYIRRAIRGDGRLAARESQLVHLVSQTGQVSKELLFLRGVSFHCLPQIILKFLCGLLQEIAIHCVLDENYSAENKNFNQTSEVMYLQ